MILKARNQILKSKMQTIRMLYTIIESKNSWKTCKK